MVVVGGGDGGGGGGGGGSFSLRASHKSVVVVRLYTSLRHSFCALCLLSVPKLPRQTTGRDGCYGKLEN